MAHTIAAVVARGDYLTVHQSSDAFVLDYGTMQRSYTPGGKSVVSAEMGVADQTSGWDGQQYRINTKAQVGSNIVETYGLSPDGAHLIDKVHIGAGEDESPWVPFVENVYIRHLAFDVRGSSFANILWVKKNGKLGRHRHRGPVFACTLEGSWRYLEYDWVARPGS